MTNYFNLNHQLNIPLEGKIQLGKDKEALSAYLEYVDSKMVKFDSVKDKVLFLVSNRYIKAEVFEPYTLEFLEKIYAAAEKLSEFNQFQTFFGAYKFFNQYSLGTYDKKLMLETRYDRIIINALAIAQGDEEEAMAQMETMVLGINQPATPTFLNKGRKHGGAEISCFLYGVEDDMSSIGRSIVTALQLSKIGGGVAIDLSDIRASGDPINQRLGAADGVVPIMKLYEDAFSYANQEGK